MPRIKDICVSLLEDMSDEEEGVASDRLTFDVVTGPGGHPVHDDDFAEEYSPFCGFATGGDTPEPCILCLHSGADQRNAKWREIISRIEQRARLAAGMGLLHRVDKIHEIYERTMRPMLGADAFDWTKKSIRNHLKGLHGTASVAMLKQVDVAALGPWLDALEDFPMTRDTRTGKVTGINMKVYKMRESLSRHIQGLSDK